MKMRKAERRALIAHLTLHVVCAWCKHVIVEGNRSLPWSHGICEKCLHAGWKEKWDDPT